MTTDLLSVILICSALLFGAVELWSSAVILLSVFTIGLFWVLRKEYDNYGTDRIGYFILAVWAVFILFILIQSLPLPSSILKFISPSAFSMQTFYSPVKRDFMHISLYPYKTGMELLLIVALFTVFAIAMSNLKNKENLIRALKVLVVFGFSLSIFAIVQKATWNGRLYWFRELTLGGSPFGTFVNRNHFAGMTGMLIPLGLGLALTRKSIEKKALFGFITLIMAVALFFSLSRGGILGFFSGMALFSFLIIKSRVQTKKIWAIGFFLMVLAVYLLYLGIDPIIDRFYKTDITGEQRLIVWSATLKAAKDFWFTGTGLGTFINIFPLYAPPGMNSIYDHAHNDYLEFILETGIVGAILLAVFVSLSIYSIAKSSLEGKTGILRIAAVSSAFTMAVHSIFDFNLHILSNALLFSFVLGMVIALSDPGFGMQGKINSNGLKPGSKRRSSKHDKLSDMQADPAGTMSHDPGAGSLRQGDEVEDWKKQIKEHGPQHGE
ncbi:MAG: O-antigen ligase family protein [Nitrospirota bacterium]